MKSNRFELTLYVIATLGFLFFVPPLFFGLIPYKIITSAVQVYIFKLGAFRFIGIVPILLGIMIYFWSAWNLTFFGKGSPLFMLPPEELVVRGLYRYVRNPIYVGSFLILYGEALLFASAALLIYASAMFALFNVFVYGEEASLRRKFGESYEQYCKFVPRWFPRLKPFRGDIPKSE